MTTPTLQTASVNTPPTTAPTTASNVAPVPFLDLGIQNRLVATEIQAGMQAVIESSSFVQGPDVTSFEQEFARFCGVEHCIGVGNGTDALEIALRASGVSAGDEVVIPANTFVATAEAVLRAGATIVLADCDEDALVDPTRVAEVVTARTSAVIPVHLYGQMAPMAAVREASPSDVVLLEDAAQAQGATQDGLRAGGVGDIAATSFYPGKNLGAFGDAGAVMTNSQTHERLARAISNHGGVRKYEHTVVGTNSRLDTLQAVALRAKLRHLTSWNAERASAATRYEQLLGGFEPVITPRVVPGNGHVWHLYVVRVSHRDRVLQRLSAAGIGAGIHYPLPVHLLPAFSYLGRGTGSFPVAERLAAESLSLPMFPGITEEQQTRVADALVQACG